MLDDLHLDLLDGHRALVDAEHAGGLAGRRAEAARELREVVGGMQPLDGLAPAVAVHEVVPVRDEVAERTAVVAEGDAAVHAPSGLLLQLAFRKGLVDLFPVPQADGYGPPRRQLAVVLQEPGELTHGKPP